MANINIETAFLTENRSVYNFFNQPGQGLYIPLYQRDYSWDSDNIDQLLEDINRGVERIAEGTTVNNGEIRFLGTIITVIEANRDKIHPVDRQALPTRIEKLIDGQQRVSTISLMSTILTKKIIDLKDKIKPSDPIFDQVEEICNYWIEKKLIPIFTFDLGRGVPKLKPKIIRGSKDYWAREDAVDTAYKSELSNYLGHFINAYINKTNFPSISKNKHLLYQNAKRIQNWLDKDIVALDKDLTGEADFVSAENILNAFSQDLLWEFERPDLKQIILDCDYTIKKSSAYVLTQLLKVITVSHYLLDRCCFTLIQPTDDDWAFDMFQSLNATGTPLTAIETFKPTVVNTVNNESGVDFKNSECEINFKKVEDLLSNITSAPQKNKRTNDFLTSFFISLDGRIISNHFSYQRKSLDAAYCDLKTFQEKKEFVRALGNYAQFYSLWLTYDGSDARVFPGIDSSKDANIASMLMLFLKSTNHKMAITILAKAYDCVIENEDSKEAVNDFVSIVKLVSAYFFIWRSSHPNSGLDSTYRDFFKSLLSKKQKVSVETVREFCLTNLKNKGITDFGSWKEKAKHYLKYGTTTKDIITLALLCSYHDTMADGKNPGLLQKGRAASSDYLCLEKWMSPDLKTIEHVAPQQDSCNVWDAALYDPDTKKYQAIGNLTLLPQDLNSSASNKGWKEKLIYYRCVSEQDEAIINDLIKEAKDSDILPNDKTIKLLSDAKFQRHLASIISLGKNGAWDSNLVDRRSEVILSIAWDRISAWL